MRSWLAGSVAALSALLVSGAASAAPVVVILKSDDLEPYARFAGAFTAKLDAEVTTQDCRGEQARCTELVAKLEARRPELVVALGPLAASTAAKVEGLRVLFAIVPAHEKYPLGGKNVAGISLTRPYKTQLEALRAVVPDLKRVGVIYDPRRSEATVDQVGDAASDLGIKLVRAKVEGGSVKKAARELAESVQAIFLIPDPVIASSAAFQELLSVSRDQKVATFALSEGMVKEGMLLALSPDYAALGVQAARLATKLTAGTSPATIGVVPPEGLVVALNLATARRLALPDEFATSVLRFAARLGCAVNVFE